MPRSQLRDIAVVSLLYHIRKGFATLEICGEVGNKVLIIEWAKSGVKTGNSWLFGEGSCI